ncbi:hypothetical protein PAXRUDRAFT_830033 [Paxillus rubicundulus Ve08.2h10]|uniref:NADAR domain-containing protein n=1 Tax=Paxillus rubicundulus Ve08.2h10 TaxID=930991 RepID=A0A0D0E4T3_9AGAM|nr:hypothetical protein PAXRUDRAFT_830033 [Paxillus rubicundulus Ve08.2h10]
MGLVSSALSACIRCWDAGDTHVVVSSGGSSHNRRKPHKISFYDKGKPYYEFTNFSPHDVLYKGKRYPTSEHLFQAFKFLDAHPQIAERIRTCGDKPMQAFDKAHKYQRNVRSDWAQVHIQKMEIALELKFTQHTDLKQKLLDTGDAELVEDSPRDWFWGVGADGTGSNELGKALMRLRDDKLRQPDHDNHGNGTGRSSAPRGNPFGTSHGVCEFCRTKPKHQHSKYCSRTCTDKAAMMCKYCRSRPKTGRYDYCSKVCADKANGR